MYYIRSLHRHLRWVWGLSFTKALRLCVSGRCTSTISVSIPGVETEHSDGDRGILCFPVQLTTSRIGNLTRLIHTLLHVMTIHTYIHTYSDLLYVSSVRILLHVGCCCCCCCCCCLHIKNRSDLYPIPFSFLLFKAKKRISVVTS